jgi:hypothetical protein
MRLALLLWLCGLLGSAAAMEPHDLADAVQDGSGVLWGYTYGAAHGVYRFDSRQWTEDTEPNSLPATAAPRGIVRMADGAVACIWQLSNKQMAVTRHAESTRLLGIVEGEVPGTGGVLPASPLADSQNRLWITGNSARIYRVDGAGVSVAHEISPAELDVPANAKSGYNTVHATEDGKGRVWIWSAPFASNWANLRGVLIFSGENIELHDLTATLHKGARVLFIARADDRHMWISVENDGDSGIYRVDIDTFALERVPTPAPRALCCVHEMFADRGDLYAVEDTQGARRALWRLRDGGWTQLLARFDDSQSQGWLPRSWLPIKEGLLVQSNPSDPWFVPSEGEPARFSWRTGFPLGAAHAFARFADGTFFAIGQDYRFFHGPLDLPPIERQNARILDLDANGGWKIDAGGRPWAALKQTPESISEWDGENWVAHAIPGGEKLTFPQNITPDHEGRIWVNVGGAGDHQKTDSFDPKSGQWQSFANTQAAYLDLRANPPHFPPDRVFNFNPQYSADRQRIAYRSGVVDIFYYDGSAWQQITNFQITGKTNDNAVGPPWFDAAGHLRVNIRPKTSWSRDDAGKWSQVPFESRYPTDIWSENSNNHTVRPVPPEGCVTPRPDSIVVDNVGTFWLTWQQALYKCIPGRCVKVFGVDETNPFIADRLLQEAFVDPHGNAFLLTAGAGMNAFIVKPKSVPPRTALAVEPVAQDAVRVRLDAAAGQPVQFRWRLDNASWQSTDKDELPLDSLPDGEHKIAVSAVDAELQVENPPVTAAFEIKIDPDQQVAGFIAQLSDLDYDKRKAAVRALAMQPERATAALRRARETAGEDARWWIDAALQAIDNRKQAEKTQPGTSD